MATDNKKTIRSLEDAQQRISLILSQINADSALARAAAANPIYALEDLGYEISPEARIDIEDRVRFGKEKGRQLHQLRLRIFTLAGHAFDLQSEEDLRRVLFQELEIFSKRQYATESSADLAASKLILPPQVRWGQKVEDPLEMVRDAHPIMAPLLAYRSLEASEPRLASRTVYDEIHQGKRRIPITSLHAVVKTGHVKKRPR